MMKIFLLHLYKLFLVSRLDSSLDLSFSGLFPKKRAKIAIEEGNYQWLLIPSVSHSEHCKLFLLLLCLYTHF